MLAMTQRMRRPDVTSSSADTATRFFFRAWNHHLTYYHHHHHHHGSIQSFKRAGHSSRRHASCDPNAMGRLMRRCFASSSTCAQPPRHAASTHSPGSPFRAHQNSHQYRPYVHSTRSCSNQIPREWQSLLQRQPTRFSLGDLLRSTQAILLASSSQNDQAQIGLMQFAQLLQEELPIRLAHRIEELEQLPALSKMPSVQAVQTIYSDSLRALWEAPSPTTPHREQDFARLLQRLYQKHSVVLIQMAKGAWEYKQQQQQNPASRGAHDDPNHNERLIQECLDRFYGSRAAIRILAGQYLASRQQYQTGSPPQSQYMGMIAPHTNPYTLLQTAIQDATQLCMARYPTLTAPPKVEIQGRLDLTFSYIPTHLHYILLELLKNAMRATVEHALAEQERRNDDSSTPPVQSSLAMAATTTPPPLDLPPIQVMIANATDNEDVVIKISDQGGGLPRRQLPLIWSYLYTTADPSVQRDLFSNTSNTTPPQGAVLAGLGYGLPLSRTYARFFGGDVDLQSLQGYGTDAFVHLVRLSDEASSSIPV